MRDFKKALLVAMLRTQRTKGLSSYIDPKQAVITYGVEFEPGQIRLAATQFRDSGLIKDAFTLGAKTPDDNLHCSLTAAGIEEAEEYEDELSDFMASSRFVPSSANSEAVDKLREKTSELRQLVEQNRDNDFVDKEGRLAEIMAFELLISQPQISVPLVEKILRETMYYLTNRFADQAIGIVAGMVLGLAAAAFGLKIPH